MNTALTGDRIVSFPPVLCAFSRGCHRSKIRLISSSDKSTFSSQKLIFVVNMLTRRFDSYSVTNEASVAFWQEFHFKIYRCVGDHRWPTRSGKS